ncbi:hypothetical protein GPECTOR_9g414 [Gonium pectorale]|uniref:Uncharacterized protein n=1 Tax=Gonium pectorale TaxID=33097 RepID=A0A150GSR6_GONPE|nr:hypothetical protein GPECTOR_9g414 [Gonium pectorale]|eukprot:KXZ52370.1 hypothetical protein GPECTOR_9g414 [Gonium pectorale]
MGEGPDLGFAEAGTDGAVDGDAFPPAAKRQRREEGPGMQARAPERERVRDPLARQPEQQPLQAVERLKTPSQLQQQVGKGEQKRDAADGKAAPPSMPQEAKPKPKAAPAPVPAPAPRQASAAAAAAQQQRLPAADMVGQGSNRPKPSLLGSLAGGGGTHVPVANLKKPLMETWEELPVGRQGGLARHLEAVLAPIYEYSLGKAGAVSACILELKDRVDRREIPETTCVSDVDTGHATTVKAVLQDHVHQIAIMESIRDKKPMPNVPVVIDVSHPDYLAGSHHAPPSRRNPRSKSPRHGEPSPALEDALPAGAGPSGGRHPEPPRRMSENGAAGGGGGGAAASSYGASQGTAAAGTNTAAAISGPASPTPATVGPTDALTAVSIKPEPGTGQGLVGVQPGAPAPPLMVKLEDEEPERPEAGGKAASSPAVERAAHNVVRFQIYPLECFLCEPYTPEAAAEDFGLRKPAPAHDFINLDEDDDDAEAVLVADVDPGRAGEAGSGAGASGGAAGAAGSGLCGADAAILCTASNEAAITMLTNLLGQVAG